MRSRGQERPKSHQERVWFRWKPRKGTVPVSSWVCESAMVKPPALCGPYPVILRWWLRCLCSSQHQARGWGSWHPVGGIDAQHPTAPRTSPRKGPAPECPKCQGGDSQEHTRNLWSLALGPGGRQRVGRVQRGQAGAVSGPGGPTDVTGQCPAGGWQNTRPYLSSLSLCLSVICLSSICVSSIFKIIVFMWLCQVLVAACGI